MCFMCLLYLVFADQLSDTYRAKPAKICATVAVNWTGPDELSIPPHARQYKTWQFMTLSVGTDHCKPGTPHMSCCSTDALTQSSSHGYGAFPV